MANTVYKVRAQLLDKDDNVIGEADVQTSADLVFFEDGETFQQKLDAGKLKGADGAKGATGATGTRGSTWTAGTACTGTSATGTVFATGIASALVNDMYLNTSTGYVYKCVTAGNASTAKWAYVGSIKGATGATGAKGETGATGAKGADGDDGADGATWLFGTATPTASNGKDGDFYLNTSTWDVYSRASGAWTKKGNIKGATGATGPTGAKGDKGDTGAAGAAGTRGSTWTTGTAITGTATSGTVFSGSGITSALVGDMYLNTSTGYVYKCTTAGAASVAKWAYVGSIKGATGAKGDTGATGAAGAKGDKGDTGATGPAGAKGDTGAKGVSMRLKGAWASGVAYVNDGSYIDIVTANGNTYGCIKSHTSSSSIGVTNTTYWQVLAQKGATGAAGADGADGAKGDKGATGTRGSTITYGTAITGTNTTGTVFSGSGISSALVGDVYINTSTLNLYRCTTAGAASAAKWSYVGCLKGATGATGAKGDKGDTGATGPAGKDGDSIKVGTSYATATERKLFLKIIE